MDEWYLPNWERHDDPEIAGSPVWVHVDYDGKPDVMILLGEEYHGGGGPVAVFRPVIHEPDRIGECLGSFTDWDTALEFALLYLERY